MAITKKSNTSTSKSVKNEPKTAPKEQPQPQPQQVEKPPVKEAFVAPPAEDTLDYSTVLDNLLQLEKMIKSTIPMIKKLQKKHDKDVKMAEKSKKTKRVRDPNAPPSGFARPGPVSKELSSFLGLNKDELIARTQVAKKISEYIKEHNLKNPDNKKEIIIDKKLAQLFKLPDKTKIEYFKIQGHLSSHFQKAA